MHQHQQGPGVLVLHHQGFDDRERVPAQLAGPALRAAVLHIVVQMLTKNHTRLAQARGGWRFAGVRFFGHYALQRRDAARGQIRAEPAQLEQQAA